MSQTIEPKKESKKEEEFIFGDMKLYLTQSPNGNRYVTVFIGAERRFYELDHFMNLYEKFHVFIVQKTKVKVSENGNSQV